jgi:hypothetical protein
MANCIVCKMSGCVREGVGHTTLYRCVRCGSFALSGSAEATLEAQVEQAPIRRSLMSHALRRMQRPDDKHLKAITTYDLPSFWAEGRLPTPQQQADTLILWVGDHTDAGSSLRILGVEIAAVIGAAISDAGLHRLLTELADRKILGARPIDNGYWNFNLTMAGWDRYAANPGCVATGELWHEIRSLDYPCSADRHNGSPSTPNDETGLSRRALVHLVSRKGLHCMACPRGEVHLSAGQHVYELPATARGAAVTALCISCAN